ncbi:MAG: hypothetical protein EPN94_00120 [Nitrospirae bacterium]|nr:MAG: hypothetical protein EPN94_00120 [Nitrospirota bacterium]
MEKGAIQPREAVPIAPVIALPKAAAPAKKGIFLTRSITAIAFLISLSISLIPLSQILVLRNTDIKKIQTSWNIDDIRFKIEKYLYENGSYPTSIEHITKMNDEWGNPFIYKTDDNNFVLLSAGPDGKEGTEDDVY